ncbi:MAG TPA: carboxypeptidase-like regulatory domain-containing protein [Bryobacteraceae bacterium]|nr:carboxypeptidase-like regulatory domain-containing protein [Bryobacteraceae bacterium]
MNRVAFCLLTAFVATGVYAQDISGTIEGSVLDPTGAVVPQAKITITNTDRSQVVRTVNSNDSGVYSAPFLPIGHYSVKVEANGFKTDERSGIVLNVDDILKVNFNLTVGQATETIEVTAAPANVDLSTPSSSTTIEGIQVRELGLGTRNFAQLVALMPGVSNQSAVDELFVGVTGASGTTTTIPYSVNGLRNSANNYTIDGADDLDRGSNLTLGSFPSIDAISEFKVQRSDYTADTGRAGGSQVTVVTKSGTSQFHGTLYEYFRNNALNANNWVNNANHVNWVDRQNPQTPCNGADYQDCYAKQSAYRWNDFGGTVGGPVPLGHYNKDKNKTFFFFSEEARRIINYATFNPIWPTQGMLQGNFIQPVCITQVTTSGIVCPSGSAPVTSIPASMINANSAAYIKDIFNKSPLSNGNTLADTSDEFFSERTLLNFREELVRVDQAFSEKFSMWGKFSHDAIPTTEPGGIFSCNLSFPNSCTTNTNSPGEQAAIHAVNIIKPNIINDAGFTYNYSAIVSTPVGLTAKTNATDVNPPEPFADPDGVIPNLSFTSGTSVSGIGPYKDYNRNYNFLDSVSWVHGRHTFRIGYSFDRYNKTENADGAQGAFGFTNVGAPSGTSAFQQSWANFLLGNVSTFTMPSEDVTPNIWAWQHEAYVQDDFKVSTRLTLYMGLRYSFFAQPTDANGEMDNFDPKLYNAGAAPAINPSNGNYVTPLSQNNPITNGIIIAGKTSPFGDKIANQNLHNFAPRLGIAWDPFGHGTTAIRAGYGIFYDSSLFGDYEQNIFADPPFVQSVSYSNASFNSVSGGPQGLITAPLTLHATPLPSLTPYTQQWNFTVEHQFVKQIVLDVAYVGTKGTHLLGEVDINEPMPGVALAAGLHTTTGTGSSGPGTTIFTTSDDPRINAVRPYLGYGPITAIESAFDSNYNALQVMAHKDFGGAGVINASYTWSKNLTDSGSDRSNAPQNSYNWHEGEYGPYPGDRTQNFTANYVYLIPIFRQSHGFVGQALKGWEFSGILSAYTGVPSTVTTSSVDPAGLGILGASPVSSRPDEICNPNVNAPHRYGAGAQLLTWFNTACFSPVPEGAVRPGNTGRYTVRGPGFFNLDASLLKNFAIAKEGRVNLQFRFETFNTLNWVNPSGFASTNNTVSTFGVISSFRAPRRVQLALKLTF